MADEEIFGTEKSSRPVSYTNTAWDWIKHQLLEISPAAKALTEQKERIEGKGKPPKKEMGSGAGID